MERVLNFTSGRRLVHIPCHMRTVHAGHVLSFTGGQRILRIPVFADLVLGKHMLQMTWPHPYHIGFTFALPVGRDQRAMRIGDLDDLRIGDLDPYPIPDYR